jgi:PEP-CTERM motif
MKRILCCVAVVLLSCGMNQAWAAVEASGGAGPSVSTDHDGNANGFAITMNVLHDPSAGPWLKHLMNTGSGIESGLLVPITEELTNIGNEAWTDWHEEIVGPVEDNTSFGPATAFAFERDSVDVYRNGNLLTKGPDYTLQFTLHPVVQPGPNPANHAEQGQHWQSVSIFFDASNTIQPSDTLTITKNIFETYLNGNIWSPGIVPVIAQYPTVPEPSTFVYLAAAVAVLGQRRLRRRR